MNWVSPNDIIKAAKITMLEGYEPACREDWLLLVNFFAVNVYKETQPASVHVLCKLMDAPVTEEDIDIICTLQMEEQ